MIKAGFYECDITPQLGAERPGDYAKRWIENICVVNEKSDGGVCRNASLEIPRNFRSKTVRI